jgi:hypothetical protein
LFVCFSGISTRKCNFCGNRRSYLGRCHASVPHATYVDTALQAANDASASRDKLVDILNRIERFFRRLEIYTSITPTTAMTDMIVEIMVEVLAILAIATKEVRRGRFSELIPGIFTLPD